MKKSAGKMFIDGFFKSFLFLFFIISIGTLSYKAVMHFFQVPDTKEEISFDQEKETQEITKARVDDVSKNVIFGIDEESGDINKLLLEIFHIGENKLTYVTIPIRTKFTMSDSLYQRLILVQPAIPQIIGLSGITKYFPEETVYDYGVLLIEDLLDIQVSYYTVIPDRIYETMFMTEQLNTEATENMNSVRGKRQLPKEVFTEEYIAYLDKLQTAEDVSNYVEEFYQSIESNLSLSDKMNYLESYCNTPKSNVYFELIAGEDYNSEFSIDDKQVKKQLEVFLSGYTIE